MIIRVTEDMFRKAFEDYGRQDNFSYDGLNALFECLEDTMGDDHELDVIGLCSEFTEYTKEELLDTYANYWDTEDEDFTFDMFLDNLRDDTLVLEVDEDSYIVQDF